MTFPAYSPIGNGETSSMSLPIQAARDPVSHVDVVSPNGSPYVAGNVWVNTITKSSFFYQGTGTWVLQSSSSGDLLTLSDNANTLVTPSGSGNIKIAGTANQINTVASTNTVTLSLTGPYTPATYTDHGVLVGSGTASIDALAVGTDGQVLIGATGLDPAFATLTSTDSSITFTPGAHTLNLGVTTGIKLATITLTSAQVKALMGTPITVLAGQGAGTTVIPLAAQLKLVYGGTNAFTNPQDLAMYVGTLSGTTLVGGVTGAGFVDQTANTYANVDVPAALTVNPAASYENQPIIIANTGASEITGNAANNNSIIVNLYYLLVTQ
jgi:hypothetical protein